MSGPNELPLDLLNEHTRQLKALEGSVAQLLKQPEEWRTTYGITEKLTTELQSIGEKLNHFIAETRGTASASASQQDAQTARTLTPSTPTVAEQSTDTSIASGSSNLRWTRRLGKIEYREVKNFMKQFTDFVGIMKISDSVAKLLLLQHLEGSALAFAESTPHKSWKDILKEMTNRVMPSKHAVLTELVSCKQNRNEKMRDFALRFYNILDEHPELSSASDEIRAILIDLLAPYWQTTARSIVFQNPEISIGHLLKGLTDIEGPNITTTNVNAIQLTQNGNDSSSASSMRRAILPDGRINWGEIRTPGKVFVVWKQLMRADPSFREDCEEWLQRRPWNSQNDRRVNFRFQGRFQNNRGNFRTRQGNVMQQGGRIFNVQKNQTNPHNDTLFDEGTTPLEQVDIAMIDRPDSLGPDGEATQTRSGQYHDFPLMYVRCKLNWTSCQCLVDTGAGTSLIPYNKVQKLGAGIDKTRCRILSSFNGDRTHTKGMSTIEVQLGNTKFSHDFCVVPGQGSKIILGNELLKKHRLTIDPAAHAIILANKMAIPCHAIDNDDKNEQPATLNVQKLKVLESVCVDPVRRGNVLFFPSGKSFVLPASSSKTLVLPYQFDLTVPVFDSNRLPIGVVCHCTTWVCGDRLKITMSNTSDTSKMIGSKAALCCVHVPESTDIEFASPDGVCRRVRCV